MIDARTDLDALWNRSPRRVRARWTLVPNLLRCPTLDPYTSA